MDRRTKCFEYLAHRDGMALRILFKTMSAGDAVQFHVAARR